MAATRADLRGFRTEPLCGTRGTTCVPVLNHVDLRTNQFGRVGVSMCGLHPPLWPGPAGRRGRIDRIPSIGRRS